MYQDGWPTAWEPRHPMSDPAEGKGLRNAGTGRGKKRGRAGRSELLRSTAGQDRSGRACSNCRTASPGGAAAGGREGASSPGDYSTAPGQVRRRIGGRFRNLLLAPLFAGRHGLRAADLKTAASGLRGPSRSIRTARRPTATGCDALLRSRKRSGGGQTQVPRRHCGRPYNKLAWQGLQQWAKREQAVLLAPKIERPRLQWWTDEAKQYHHQHQP